ncbi:MAG TPA: ATP synthase F1 subunit gamma [Clostridia bacterium]|nr:ATP synthase F1 subunit gamma [Clostridia bacterium]
MKNKTEIKHRIHAISQTRQITKAMHLISIAKMKRVMARYQANSFYFDHVRTTLKDILNHSGEMNSQFFTHRKTNRAAYIVIGGDKGLAGGYNHEVIKEALRQMKGKDNVYVMSIGQIVNHYFYRHGVHVNMEFLHMSQNPSLYNARTVAETLVSLYEQDALDEVWVVYTHLVAPSVQQPRTIKILPIEKDDFKDVADVSHYSSELMFFPSIDIVCKGLVTEYLIGIIYAVLVQAFASEQAARVAAMDSATRNATEFIRKLTLEYNQVRQEQITNEIAEITAGADALLGRHGGLRA